MVNKNKAKIFLKHFERTVWIAVALFFGSFQVVAQEQTIRGTVRSGVELLPGVSVYYKANISEGVVTDEQGGYNIKFIHAKYTPFFISIGYQKTEIPVGARSLIDVDLKSDNVVLNEVVVVGYGSQDKASLTGAVATLKGTDILRSPTADISNALAGRTPGVIATNSSGEPGNDGSNIYIRGVSTFSGATSPLIVIDGVANRPDGFQRIDPNDVESISVLKDASAAIYGAQSANGVILVTTKKGKTGKPTLTFSQNFAFNTWGNPGKYLNAAEYAQMRNEISIFGGGTPTYTDAEIAKFREGSDPIRYPDTNWLKLATKDISMQYRTNAALSGGTDKIKYHASAGTLQQDGQFKKGVWGFKQHNIIGNVEGQVTKKLSISFGTQLRWQEKTGSPIGVVNTFSSLMGALPTVLAINPDGSYSPGGLSNGGNLNPLVNSTDGAGITATRNLTSLNTLKARFDLPFVEGLFLDGFLAVDVTAGNNKNWNKAYQVYAYNPDDNTYSPQTQNGRLGLASLDLLKSSANLITQNFKLNYEKIFGVHSIHAFVAYEQSKLSSEYTGAHKDNFISTAIPELDFGSSATQRTFGHDSLATRINYFGRVNYNYQNIYFFEGTLRRDGSYKFSKAQRFGWFPAFSVGVKLSEFKWFKDILPAINSMKLRASFGKLGNDNIAPYQYDQFYFINQNGRLFHSSGGVAANPTFYSGVLANPKATWESQTSANMAMDVGILRNKLTFTVEFFNQKRSDILAPRNASIPLYTGIILPDENIGIVRNRGIEIQVEYKDSYKHGGYYISGNMTYARNKIIFQDEKISSKPDYQVLTGNPVGTSLLYRAIGVFKTLAEIDDYADYTLGSQPMPGDLKFEDVNQDGLIDQKDQIIIPYTHIPQITYGISLGCAYKRFNLDMLFQGQAHAVRYFRAVAGKQANFLQADFDGRSTPGNITDKPRASEIYGSPQGLLNTYYLSNTAFLRLKNIELSYHIKNKVFEKWGIKKTRMYMNAFNLLTFTKYKGLDPEAVDLQQSSIIPYPTNITYNLGLNITF